MRFTLISIGFLAVLALGLSAGASLAEVATLVPFWQKSAPADFYAWYVNNKDTLVAFYSPLQIYSTVLAMVAAALFIIKKEQGNVFMILAAVFALAVIATFFLFFKDANAALAAGQMNGADLKAALSSWANWQWLRIVFGTLAFAFAIGAFIKRR